MPKRPREHELEAESRTAFKTLMERRGWVVRPVDAPDYGLDDLVEVFAEGEATGLLFYVQVRGTDESDLRKALAVRVRAEQQTYFDAVGHPVLVVRYQAGTRRLFGRWFHRFDPHPRHGGETLRLQESDELLDGRIEALAGEVRLYRAVSSAAIAWPLATKVSSLGRHRPGDAALAMAAAAGRQPYVQFVAADEFPHAVGLTVDVLREHMVVHGGRSSVTLHGRTEEQELDALAPDAVLAVGVVLGTMEHLDAAASLIVASAPNAPSFEGEILVQAVSTLARGRRIGDALTVGRALAAQDRRAVAAFVVGTVAMATSDMMSEEELAAVVAFDEALASEAEAAGRPEEAAAICYSLGNWLFSVVHDWERALAMFERAVALDRSYASRGYFMHERGGALFECRRYDDAIAAYERVLKSDVGDSATVARLADALLMAGRFSAAAVMFDRYLAHPVPSEPAWELKAAVARFLVDQGYAEQVRDEDAAFALAVQAEELDDDPVTRTAKCEEALALDALCAAAWQLIALAQMETDPRGAAVPMVIGALAVQRPELWAVTLLVLLGAGEESLAKAAIANALIEGGPEFANAVRGTGVFFGPDVVDSALAVVRDVEATMVWPEPGFTVRLPGEDGGLSEHRVQ